MVLLIAAKAIKLITLIWIITQTAKVNNRIRIKKSIKKSLNRITQVFLQLRYIKFNKMG